MPALPFSYRIRRSARASRTRVIVSHGMVEVVAPDKVAERRIHQFVEEKALWINQTLAKLAARAEQHTRFTPVRFEDGELLVYQGQALSLSVRQSRNKRPKIEHSEALIVYLPESVFNLPERQTVVKSALQSWLKQQLKSEVENIIGRHSQVSGLMPCAIRIKAQKSRWGSCSARNNININWLLALAPPQVLEYVVVHELCHIKVKNHSQAFWDLVALHLPEYRRQRLWLKTHGAGLMQAFQSG